MTSTPTASAPKKSTGAFHRLQVADVEPLGDDAVSIGLRLPETLLDAFAFLPGQHVPVRVPSGLLAPGAPEERRTYSLCTAPSRARASRRLRIGVRRIAGGTLSGHLVDALSPGDVLEVGEPTGGFVLTPPPTGERAQHMVGLVGGSGITPVLAMASELLAADPAARVTIVAVNRTAESAMFVEDLADLKDAHPTRLMLTHILTREPQTAPVLSQRPSPESWKQLLDGVLAGAAEPTGWFLCGPRDLVTTARAAVLERGVKSQCVHVELFHAGEPLQTPEAASTMTAASSITAHLGGRRTEIASRPDDASVLDAVLRARADAPYACRGGVCGTCRARLLDGEVAMADQWALEPAEVDAGYVLTCRSRPVTAGVVVDFDA